MRILSWNINGIRAAHKKGFLNWLANCEADIVGVQEVRADLEQIPLELKQPDGWHTNFVKAKRPGYSGVGLFCKSEPALITHKLGKSEFDIEGRLQIAHFGKLVLANVYFPNGKGKDRDNSRIPYKLSFYSELFELLKPLAANNVPVLVMGDFNTAHKEIDLARPKANQKTSGFCPEERAELDKWVNAGYVDTFRLFNKEPNNYTWWSNRSGARERNVGWRIDYIFASKHALPYVKNAFVLPEVKGSDHCPIGVELSHEILI